MKFSFAILGQLLGGFALLLALVHFWAGPITPTPSLEQTVAEKVSSVREAALGALKGERFQEVDQTPRFDADRIAHILVAVCGGLALIFASIAFSRREPSRLVIVATVLGVAAITFQLFSFYVMMILAAVFIIGWFGLLG